MTETVLPIEIKTGYQTGEGDTLCISFQRAEKAAHYLGSLFRLISYAAISYERADETEMQYFVEDLRHVSEIGESIAASVFASIQPFESIAYETDKGGENDEQT